MSLSTFAAHVTTVATALALVAGRAPAEPTDARALAQPLIDARAVIERLNEAMTDALKRSDELGFTGRVETLAPVITTTFDLGFMAEKSLGGHWRKLTDEQGDQWRQSFGNFMVASYASRLDEYSGQVFETLGEEAAPRDTINVRTRVRAPEEEDVALTYRLRETPAGWRVIDIYLKGTISELAVRRSDYNAVLKSSGFEKLLENLRAKTAGFAD